MSMYPAKTSSVVRFAKIIRHRESKVHFDDRMSSRMVRCASVLQENDFIGWMMDIPSAGSVQMSIFGSSSICSGDLKWIAENTATFQDEEPSQAMQDMPFLYELVLSGNEEAEKRMGFGVSHHERQDTEQRTLWPVTYSTQFAEIIRALREEGAVFCSVIGPATMEEQSQCRNRLQKNWSNSSVNVQAYVGTPVKARFLIGLPGTPSVRIRSVFETAVPGIRIEYLGTASESNCMNILKNPMEDAAVLPDYAVRIMLMEPVIRDNVTGIATCDEPMHDVPADYDSTDTERAIRIGTATGSDGQKRDVEIGETDLRRHTEILGSTGTGKSTLIANMILQAIKKGYPCTFLDPHGSTIDTILHSIPEEFADRIRVVRIGDADNPVPLNYWDTGDPHKEERNISDLCELFRDIFDPHNDGIVGPRYERWLSTFAKASLALLGRRASLESIAVLSQSKDNMLKLSKAIVGKYPELVETIKEEYGKDNSNEFNATLSWYLSKFQSLTSVEQLRMTLGAGTNALDFANNLDGNTVTLIDLASPEIGANCARIIGTMILTKLWSAVLKRKDRSRTHLLFLDEAQVYCKTNPLPRMLAESRKFGLAVVLCHQHEGQLTTDIRESLEANSANLISFRLSPKDAAATIKRLDDGEQHINLARLDAFKAIASISVDGLQTSPFTLRIDKVEEDQHGKTTARMIERRSIETLVEPFRHLKALTPAEIVMAMEPRKMPSDDPKPNWLEQWMQERTG